MPGVRFGGLQLAAVLFLGALLTLPTTGCGSSSTAGPPQGEVVPTANPLVATYTVASYGKGQVWVEFGLDASYGRQTPPVAADSASTNLTSVLVGGMRPSTTYHMRAHLEAADGQNWVDQDRTFTTGSIPSRYAIGLTVTRPAQTAGAPSQQGVELLNLSDTGSSDLQNAVTDLEGNVIWYYNAEGPEFASLLKPLGNGHMIADLTNVVSRVNTLREIDLAGNTIHQITSTELDDLLLTLGRSVKLYQFHHDILPLPNGHIILLANTMVPFDDLPGYPGTTNVIGDVLIDLDPSWTPVWFWSSFDHLDINRHLQGLPDWTHSNAVLYTPNDGNLLLSIRHQSWVIKIDYADGSGTGNILWKLGQDGDFTLAGGDPSQWFYAQHFPNVLNINGSQLTLGVFDNGNLRILNSNGDQCGAAVPCYSRAAIFNVDEAARVASLAWQLSPGFYSPWGGTIGIVDNGNVEFDMTAPFPSSSPPGFEARSRVEEVTPDTNPTLVWQMDIDGASAYRAYRIPSLYPGMLWTE